MKIVHAVIYCLFFSAGSFAYQGVQCVPNWRESLGITAVVFVAVFGYILFSHLNETFNTRS